MLLTGCMGEFGEDLLALPELPTQYRAVQHALNQLEGQNGYVSAVAGAHRQPVQMIDLDADGVDEAVVFDMDDDGLCRVHVLRNYNGSYALVCTVSGSSADLYEVRYPVLTAEGRRGIAAVWGQAQDATHGVTLIALGTGPMPQVYSFSCQSYLFQDTDRDGADEIWYADRGGAQLIRSRLQCYEYNLKEGFLPVSRIQLAAEAKYTVSLRAGLCYDGIPAIFADSYTENRQSLVTDLIVEMETGFVSMTQGRAGSAASTLRSTEAISMDINGDGVLEVPVDMGEVPAWLPGSRQFIDWCDFSSEIDGPRIIAKTFYMPDQGLAMMLSGDWYHTVQVTQWLDEDGNRVYSFYDRTNLHEEESGTTAESLVLRLCIGEARRVDEMQYENIVILEEVAVGIQIPETPVPGQVVTLEEVGTSLRLLQDRW